MGTRDYIGLERQSLHLVSGAGALPTLVFDLQSGRLQARVERELGEELQSPSVVMCMCVWRENEKQECGMEGVLYNKEYCIGFGTFFNA